MNQKGEGEEKSDEDYKHDSMKNCEKQRKSFSAVSWKQKFIKTAVDGVFIFPKW